MQNRALLDSESQGWSEYGKEREKAGVLTIQKDNKNRDRQRTRCIWDAVRPQGYDWG